MTDPAAPEFAIVTPAPRGSRRGNRVSALRWTRVLRGLGYRVRLSTDWTPDSPGDPLALLALHARHSAPAVQRWAAAHPDRPLFLALTGTDLYDDIPAGNADALASLGRATRLITLHPAARDDVPPEHRDRTRAIVQSVAAIDGPPPSTDRFDVCVVAHLRPVKDPLRAALAARQLPADSRVHVTAIGAGLDPELADAARAEADANPRFDWVGELPRRQARQRVAASQLVVLSSQQEGGANVVGEAIRAGVPLLATRINGSVGLLGPDYPGYFPVGDTDALAGLLRRAETDPAFLAALHAACDARRPMFEPAGERRAWTALLDEVGLPVPVRP